MSAGTASPQLRIPAYLPPLPSGRTIAIGAEKASRSDGPRRRDAMVGFLLRSCRHSLGHRCSCERVEIVEASHPVPDANGMRAAAHIQIVQGLGPDDLVLALISGGGSSLLSLPAPGLTLADKQAINAALLRSGAVIGEMNAVRKHLSAIKGGRLAAAAYPASVVTLVTSDVPADDPAIIASGPTVPDTSTFADALAMLEKYGIAEPRAVIDHLKRGADETPKPCDARLAHVTTKMIATPQLLLEAAAVIAREAGVTPLILGDALEGELREVGRVMAGIADRSCCTASRFRLRPSCCPGGETTVTVRGRA